MVHPSTQIGTDALAGYRLIRRIGSGSRSEVFLAQPAAIAPDRSPVALKVFRGDADADGIGREVRALLNTPLAALARLDDVATAPDGRVCLVLKYLPGPTLDRLLTERGRISAAEVVTIAATVTATLQALHDVGLSHPLVRPAGVRFEQTGRPVLLNLGSLGELPSGVAGVAVRRDATVALTGFLQALLAYLDPGDPAAPTADDLLATFASTTAARPFPPSLAGLEEALFDWAPAGPVLPAGAATPTDEAGSAAERPPLPALVSVRAVDRVASPPAGGVGRTDLPVAAATPPRLARPRARVGRRVTSSPVRAALGSALGSAARLGRAGLERIGSMRAREKPSRDRRPMAGRPVLLGVGLAAILSMGGVAALSAIPPESAQGSNAGSGSSTGVSGPAGDSGAQPGHLTSDTSPEPDSGRPDAPEPRADPSVLTADDPAAAVVELLRRRRACMAAASVLCLDGVDQPGSVAMAADGYLIRQLPTGPAEAAAREEPETPLTATVQEHTGNSALVVLGEGPADGVNAQPASALVIKGEAGWRLRELFDY
jgi:hypothetical protein